MSEYERDLSDLDIQLDALGTTASKAANVSAALQKELRSVSEGMSSAEQNTAYLSKNLSSSMKTAFSDIVLGGAKASDVLRNVGMSLMRMTVNQSMAPIAGSVSNLLSKGLTNAISSFLPFENGAAFSQGCVMPFAKGGVVTSPTRFPMKGGTGLMGEAGAEAIMPLSKGPDGSLGVRSNSTPNNVTVNMNISTPDATSFQRSKAQIAAGVQRALSRGQSIS